MTKDKVKQFPFTVEFNANYCKNGHSKVLMDCVHEIECNVTKIYSLCLVCGKKTLRATCGNGGYNPPARVHPEGEELVWFTMSRCAGLEHRFEWWFRLKDHVYGVYPDKGMTEWMLKSTKRALKFRDKVLKNG